MQTRIRRAITALVGAAVIVLGGGLAYGAYAAVSGGPPITAPSPPAGPVYSGPVHECVAIGNESVAYFELHSTTFGNCAAGYRQITTNEITPAFTLTLGTAGGASTAYNCTAATAQAETAITCTAPSPSPSSAPSTSSSG